MGTPYLGELRVVAFNYAPKGWALCNGQLLSISQNTALFSILGTYYGGNGVNTFALPNLQGMSAVHVGNGFTQGQVGGEMAHTLSQFELPAHTHPIKAGPNAPTKVSPAGAAWASGAGVNRYAATGTDGMSTATIGLTGGSQPHDNMSPYLVLNVVIALFGIFPSRS